MPPTVQTVKKSILPNGQVLRMNFTIEGVYFIFIECERCITPESQPHKEVDMLWNGTDISEANHEFDKFKNNPWISGDNRDGGDFYDS